MPKPRAQSASCRRSENAVSLWMQTRHQEAHSELEAAAAEAKPRDADGHWALHQAFTLGVGEMHTLERWRRAFYHLRRAAQAGMEPMLLMMVAAHYWDGRNGVSRDLVAAHAWLELAAETGSADARAMYDEFRRKNKSFSARA